MPRHFPTSQGNGDTRQNAAAQLLGFGPGGIALQAPPSPGRAEEAMDPVLPESQNDEKFALFGGMDAFCNVYLILTHKCTPNATLIAFPLIPYLL